MKFNEVFADLVKSSNLTQSEIAKGIGITQQTISGYKHGVFKPDLETLIKIAAFFNVPTDYLLSGVRAENKPVQEILKLSDKAIENLKFLAENTEFFDELLSDKKFAEMLNSVIHLFLKNLVMISIGATKGATKEREYYIHCNDEKSLGVTFTWVRGTDEQNKFHAISEVETKSVKSISEYFADFFKRINFIRNNEPMPPSIKKEFRKIEKEYRELSREL